MKRHSIKMDPEFSEYKAKLMGNKLCVFKDNNIYFIRRIKLKKGGYSALELQMIAQLFIVSIEQEKQEKKQLENVLKRFGDDVEWISMS